LLGLAASPAHALDLNAFRAQHKKPPLAVSSALSAAAYEHAHDLARRNQLDHKNFRQRVGSLAATAAENVLYGCETEDCAIRMWAKSPGHRRNMLLGSVSRYGIASARAESGRHYWVMVLGSE
jgi:uncharacterized protein YkwD